MAVVFAGDKQRIMKSQKKIVPSNQQVTKPNSNITVQDNSNTNNTRKNRNRNIIINRLKNDENFYYTHTRLDNELKAVTPGRGLDIYLLNIYLLYSRLSYKITELNSFKYQRKLATINGLYQKHTDYLTHIENMEIKESNYKDQIKESIDNSAQEISSFFAGSNEGTNYISDYIDVVFDYYDEIFGYKTRHALNDKSSVGCLEDIVKYGNVKLDKYINQNSDLDPVTRKEIDTLVSKVYLDKRLVKTSLALLYESIQKFYEVYYDNEITVTYEDIHGKKTERKLELREKDLRHLLGVNLDLILDKKQMKTSSNNIYGINRNDNSVSSLKKLVNFNSDEPTHLTHLYDKMGIFSDYENTFLYSGIENVDFDNLTEEKKRKIIVEIAKMYVRSKQFLYLDLYEYMSIAYVFPKGYEMLTVKKNRNLPESNYIGIMTQNYFSTYPYSCLFHNEVNKKINNQVVTEDYFETLLLQSSQNVNNLLNPRNPNDKPKLAVISKVAIKNKINHKTFEFEPSIQQKINFLETLTGDVPDEFTAQINSFIRNYKFQLKDENKTTYRLKHLK